MNSNKIITELTDEQIDDLLAYTPPYTEENVKNIKALTLKKIKPKKKHKSFYRIILISAALILALTIGVSSYYINNMMIKITKTNGIISESMEDYEFILDEEAVGKWEIVDFVRNIEDFEAGRPHYKKSDLFWRNITFNDDGTVVSTADTGVNGSYFNKRSGIMINNTYQWTKGYIIDDNNKIIPSYTIKNIDGSDYMFIQWKSGDYTIRGMEPCYYVFKKTLADFPSAEEYLAEVLNERLEERRNEDPNITINIDEDGNIYDTMDYEFVLDEEALGKWEAVDFVKNIDDFNPEIPQFKGDFFWANVTFNENGKIKSNLGAGKWTKGYILQFDTISSYIIKNIDGEDYMFIQWKAGDYTVGRMKPCYYVFARVD